jgi:bifunctional diaminopimelate decarboxylase / aspartate kinase
MAALGGRLSAYVYDAESIRAAATELRELESVSRVLYAMKANPHPQIVRTLAAAGLDFECVSAEEVQRVLEVCPDIERQRIHYTPNFAPREEYIWAFEQRIHVTVDNGYTLEAWPEVFRGRDIFIRIDTGIGRGHHQYVRTGGAHSKFGVPVSELDEVATRVHEIGARIVGLHAHNGSGIFDVANWADTAILLAELAQRFADVRVIDIGGGFGVPESPEQAGIDFRKLDAALSTVHAVNPQLEIWIEPGRYLVAAAGVLLARVTQLKSKEGVRYIGVATGMNSLLRPALYGAYHAIANLTRLEESADQLVNVVGPICESADVLGHERLLPSSTQAGDVLLIANAGAYGHAMSSRYNLREPAEELVL